MHDAPHPRTEPAPALPSRRALFATGAALVLAAPAAGAQTGPPAPEPKPPLMPAEALVLPRTEFVYEAVFELAPTMALGDAPLGERRIVPITGGTFEGPNLRGKVLAGGADRQLIRKDGVRRLDALYELQTDDGAVLTVRNQVLIDEPKDRPRYAFSSVEITAPEGKYGWLNRLVFVGTLHSLRPRPAVLIRVYKLT